MSQNINLYDPALRVRRDLLGFDAVFAAAVVALLVVGLGGGYARWSAMRAEPIAAALAAQLQELQAQMQTAATQTAALRPDGALQAETARVQRALLQRRAALANIDAGGIGSESGFSSRLEALARQSVDGLWLTGLMLRPDDVLLRGRATRPALIPLYVQRLEHEPTLQGRTFKALDVNRPLDGLADSQPATDAPGAARAEFVEFTLTGPGSLPAPATDKGARP